MNFRLKKINILLFVGQFNKQMFPSLLLSSLKTPFFIMFYISDKISLLHKLLKNISKK